MSQAPEAVLFDVDGVLIDSLAAHLDFCRDEAEELELLIEIPDIDEFRALVRGGKKVSPMRDFFLAVGFPEGNVDEAVSDYEAKFAKQSELKMFDGVSEMLATLHKSGIKLGLITSNVRKNVEPVLGAGVLRHVEPAAQFFHEPGTTKAQQIAKAAEVLKADITRCVFVGDQPADETAAKDAGSKFVGVTYGWGFASGEYPFETAQNVSAIPMAVQRAVFELPNPPPQFDYAWKWFNYHADQRVKMFNYMFVGLALFATALTNTVGKGYSNWVPVALLIVAGVVSLIFSLLDRRNEYLVRLGEDVLFELEKRIFGMGEFTRDRNNQTISFGILWRQAQEHPEHGLIADVKQGRHRLLLRLIAWLLAAMFFAAALLLFLYRNAEKLHTGD